MEEYQVEMKTKDKLEKIQNFFSNKKIEHERIINISKLSVIADYFIIVSVDNMRAVDSIKNDLIDFCDINNIEIRNKDNLSSPWVLIDLNDIVIHIFTEEMREFYNLERLWADGEIVK